MLSQCEDGKTLSGNQAAGIEASATLLLGYALVETELDHSDNDIMRDNLS